ncbi:MAG: hypothetical protein M0R38_04940 [Bacteroidia bacterium]|nr:hypothetical protein [Bacteroidia bacterium]
MKQIATIYLSIATLFMACGRPAPHTGEATEVAKKEWKTHENSIYSIQYPKDWTLDETGKMGAVFVLFSPELSDPTQFRVNINLITEDLSQRNIGIDEYMQLSEDALKEYIADVKIIENKRISRDKGVYHKLVFSAVNQGAKLKWEQHFHLKNQTAYVLTLTSDEANFDKFKDVGETVLQSFVLKD